MEGLGFAKQKLIRKIVEDNFRMLPDEKRFTFQELLFVIQEMTNEEGRLYLEESKQSAKYGHTIFRNFVKHLLYRNIANYDSMVLVTSEKGTGKSSAAIMMAREWCRMLGIRFDPKRHIAYNNADVMRAIDNLNKFEPLICDESIRFASASDWNKRENKELKKKLAEVRTKHLFFILCFPLKVYKLEKTYLDSFVNYWVDLFGRGQGAIYVKDRNPVNDAWRMKDFKNVGSYTEFTILSKVEKQLKKHPNFWQIIKFPKPPRWLYEKYLRVREKNVYDDDDILNSTSSLDVQNSLLVLALRDIMMNDTSLTMNRIILHIKNEYDIPITKKAVQDAIDDATQLVQKIREVGMAAIMDKNGRRNTEQDL